jgi:hypothetical protein
MYPETATLKTHADTRHPTPTSDIRHPDPDIHGPHMPQLATMTRFISLVFLPAMAAAFSHHHTNNAPIRRVCQASCFQSSTLLKNDLRDEIENAAQRKAYENRSRGEGVGETAAGAILGGLLGGPFGALVSADEQLLLIQKFRRYISIHSST